LVWSNNPPQFGENTNPLGYFTKAIGPCQVSAALFSIYPFDLIYLYYFWQFAKDGIIFATQFCEQMIIPKRRWAEPGELP